jgi:hypothetical protein
MHGHDICYIMRCCYSIIIDGNSKITGPPVISSFSFDDNLQEGQRTSISCNVMSGDLPIEITWLKDFHPIPTHLNITAMRVKFLSNLIFEELKGEMSGTYTCSASNAAETVTFSSHLSVKGKSEACIIWAEQQSTF